MVACWCVFQKLAQRFPKPHISQIQFFTDPLFEFGDLFMVLITERYQECVVVIPRVVSLNVSAMMNVKFLFCGLANLACELVPLKNLKSFLLPTRVSKLFGIGQISLPKFFDRPSPSPRGSQRTKESVVNPDEGRSKDFEIAS